jgi:hypothetical protein
MTEILNPFTEAMLNVAGEVNKMFEDGAAAEKSASATPEYGKEKMDKASWNKDWANKTPFQRQMEIDDQGQQNILNNLNGYAGGA